MINKIEFLTPRLTGKRFNERTIPLEFLKDFAVLAEMIIEVAKWHYLRDHPERHRIKRGFAEGISLDLQTVDSGSAIPVLALLVAAGGNLFANESQECFEKARESIINAMSAAETTGQVTQHLDEKFLSYFNHFGRSLRDGEAIEFRHTTNSKVTFTRETRKKLVLASSRVQELSDEVTLRGKVPEVDQEKATFQLQMNGGQRVNAPIPEQFRAVILEALNGYHEEKQLLLQGVATFNRKDKITRVDEVEHIGPIDPNDIETRVEELRLLQPGWFEGHGASLSAVGLGWLVSSFDHYYPDDLPLPYLYPTPEAGVQAEWSFDRTACSLEIDLVSHRAYWHTVNLETQFDAELQLDLDAESDWQRLTKELKKLKGDQT